jgi:precorrin-6B methylase 2
MLFNGNPLFERLNNLRWETQLGIATRGISDDVHKPDSFEYSAMNYSKVQSVLQHLSLQSSDIFVDVGCGKGRVVCCAARHPCRKVIGVEYSEDLCRQARTNSERLRGRKAPVLIHNGIAEEFDYTKATTLFFFRPFGGTTLDAVLHRINHDTRQEIVRFAFVNPSAEHDEVFARHSWLERYDYWKVDRGADSVSYYRRKLAAIN